MIYNFDHDYIMPNYSKSITHRVLFASLLTGGITYLDHLSYSDDVKTTINLLVKCNCIITKHHDGIKIDASHLRYNNEIIDFKQSGTTMRFAIPIISYLFQEFLFTGDDSLLKRPIDGYDKLLNIKKDGNCVIIKYIDNQSKFINIDGSKSSQFISGLLFILPLLEHNTILYIKNGISIEYIKLTIEVLKKFNIKIKLLKNYIYIKGKQQYKQNIVYQNELDESSLSYLKALKYSGSKIQFNVNKTSIQADRIIDKIILKKPKIINCKNNPDLVPTLIFLIQMFNQVTILKNIKHLEYKESNRIKAIMEFGNNLGMNIVYKKNNLYIKPATKMNSFIVNTYHDHRICMMAILFKTQIDLTIKDFVCIKKSFPEFYEIIKRKEKA